MFSWLVGKKKDTPAVPAAQPAYGGTNVAGVRPSVQQSASSSTATQIANMSREIENVEKKIQLCKAKADAEVTKAKHYLEGKNRTGAAQCLKRKKMYEDQIMKFENTKFNMEQMKISLEGATLNESVVGTMVSAKEHLKNLTNTAKVDEVENLMDDIGETMQASQQISDALSGQLNGGLFVDEDEIGAELDSLEQESLDSQLLQVNAATVRTVPNAPAITTHAVPATRAAPVAPKPVVEEDPELLALEKSLSTGPSRSKAVANRSEVDDEMAALEAEMS